MGRDGGPHPLPPLMPGQEGLKLEEKVLASSPGTGAMACRTLPPRH